MQAIACQQRQRFAPRSALPQRQKPAPLWWARPVANGTTVWPEAQRTLSEQPKGECEVNPVHTDHYPSRQHDEPRWQKRLDPVVYRSDLANAPIPAELIERFERDGYLVIPTSSAPRKSRFSAKNSTACARTRPSPTPARPSRNPTAARSARCSPSTRTTP